MGREGGGNEGRNEEWSDDEFMFKKIILNEINARRWRRFFSRLVSFLPFPL